MNVADIVAAMGLAADDAIQTVQTRYRVSLAEHWGIRPGARVLEIGCGQGDMTAALAAAVGPTGLVAAYDIAAPTYGAPVTIGEAQARLAAGPLGKQVHAHLATDVLQADFAPRSFDVLVIAHATWYFPGVQALLHLIAQLAPAVDTIAIADWSLAVRDARQVAHLLAAWIQATCAEALPNGEANIRTLITPAELTPPLEALGFAPTTAILPTLGMQDGQWEVSATPELVAQLPQDAPVRRQVAPLVAALAAQAEIGTQALDAFAITATRRQAD
ncbi:class I SAM-dependent methyltransferase [Lacticaseibacillus suihuaensis]